MYSWHGLSSSAKQACSVVMWLDWDNHYILLLFQVRMTAFHQLGPFISTFADSDFTGMYVEDGSLVFRPSEEMMKR